MDIVYSINCNILIYKIEKGIIRIAYILMLYVFLIFIENVLLTWARYCTGDLGNILPSILGLLSFNGRN